MQQNHYSNSFHTFQSSALTGLDKVQGDLESLVTVPSQSSPWLEREWCYWVDGIVSHRFLPLVIWCNDLDQQLHQLFCRFHYNLSRSTEKMCKSTPECSIRFSVSCKSLWIRVNKCKHKYKKQSLDPHC